MIGVTVLGSTGSIGVSTLDVIERHPEKYRVVALTANRDVDGLFHQVQKHRPDYAVVADAEAGRRLGQRLAGTSTRTRLLVGLEALEEVASLPEVDYVMAAIVGAAGLRPALAAAHAGKRLLLANKEALVVAGQVFVDAVRQSGAELLPIDSEHNAIFQCLPPGFSGDREGAGVRRILLTASGGPFRTWPLEALREVIPEQACAHPNWNMGRKISVDSATMMNKGLEVIEAHWLFGLSADHVDVVIHPQSIIHSMVEYADGSVLAQMGNPDMRTPIAHALAWPDRIEAGVDSLDLFEVAHLDFEAPDLERFPCLGLAFDALRGGGDLPAVLNAANEVAVQAFLEHRIPFTGIPKLIEAAMAGHASANMRSVDDLLMIDGDTRRATEERIGRMA